MSSDHILVTGGAGYIGSHAVVELLQSNYQVTILDNFDNSSRDVPCRIKQITDRSFNVIDGDIRDPDIINEVFANENFDGVLHFAGLKSVSESISYPERYYECNVGGTANLISACRHFDVRRFVFSSSATVYSPENVSPISETGILGPINPYGQSKLDCERILQDAVNEIDGFSVALLRYFNPVGSHESGLIGESPIGAPNNLMPLIVQTALGEREKLIVFGTDYVTKDGTGVRDYIHVVDLALGHVKALDHIDKSRGVSIFNLGTGQGYSVLEMIHSFEETNNVKVPYEFGPRRPGDLGEVVANPDRARMEMNWSATRNLYQMCQDSWSWRTKADTLDRTASA